MVRATSTEVTKLFGGTLPPGWVGGTLVSDVCTQMDYHLDSKTAPNTLSTSSNAVKQLANELVYRWIIHSIWGSGGGPLSDSPEPPIWTTDMLDRLERLSTDTTFKGFTTGRQRET